MRPIQNALISGASRGIGLELTKQLASNGTTVFATCRTPSKAGQLNELAAQFPDGVHVIKMDVTHDAEVAEAAQMVAGKADNLDLIINNAGVNSQRAFANFDAQDFLKTLDINAVGAMRVASAFVNLLKNGTQPVLVNISSQLGSILEQKPNFGWVDYNTSKAAMNVITKHLSYDLAADGIVVISMHPGWVQTDMGGSNATVAVPDSAGGILSVIDGLTAADNGEFYIYNGEKHPW